MRREIVIYIDGVKADTYKDLAVTLDFNSSILADVSSIKCSGSKTIRLPKTQTNDRIFDLPHLPSYESSKAHVKMPCSVYVGGITIIDKGLCYLLASDGDHYEVAVTFGIMHSFEQWTKNKPKLRDLKYDSNDYIEWKASAGVSDWVGGVSSDTLAGVYVSLFYAQYDCGVSDTSLINIHPCVTLREVFYRIIKENNLDITLPMSVNEDMMSKAIVLKNIVGSLNTLPLSLSVKQTPAEIWGMVYNSNSKRLYFNIDSDMFDITTSTFVQKGIKQVTFQFKSIYLNFYYGSSTTNGIGLTEFLPAVKASPSDYALVLEPVNGSSVTISPSVSNNVLTYSVNRTFTFNVYDGDDNDGKPLLKAYIKLRKWNTLPDAVWENPSSTYTTGTPWYWDNYSLLKTFRLTTTYGGTTTTSVAATYQENNNGYPMDKFELVGNLPDITQMDFINFIAKFYGLYPVQRGEGVALVNFATLLENIENGDVYDWSKALTEQYTDCPNNIAQTIDGYAQRNVVRYKEDKNDALTNEFALVVEDNTLEDEKKFIEFPFAASRGNVIPQYSISEDGGLVKNDCEYRLMHITYGESYTRNTLYFTDAMKPQQIVNRHYASLQDVIRKPMQIEETMDLSLIDLQSIDYSKPVYLAKYGRYFAIISVQWQSDSRFSKVKLLRIR